MNMTCIWTEYRVRFCFQDVDNWRARSEAGARLEQSLPVVGVGKIDGTAEKSSRPRCHSAVCVCVFRRCPCPRRSFRGATTSSVCSTGSVCTTLPPIYPHNPKVDSRRFATGPASAAWERLQRLSLRPRQHTCGPRVEDPRAEDETAFGRLSRLVAVSEASIGIKGSAGRSQTGGPETAWSGLRRRPRSGSMPEMWAPTQPERVVKMSMVNQDDEALQTTRMAW